MNRHRIRFAWLAVAVAWALLVVQAGCKKAEDGGGGPVDAALTGTWRLSSMSVNGGAFFPPAQIGWSVELTLDSDGGFTYSEVWQGASESSRGTWSAVGGVVTLRSNSVSWQGPYTVAGGTFTATFENYDGEGHRGTLVFSRT